MKYVPTFIFLLLSLALSSCYEAPVFSPVPYIEFGSLRFAESDRRDSLILSFRFQDGDADIGLSSDGSTDQIPPFHPFSIIVDGNGDMVSLSSTNHVAPFYQIPMAFVIEDGVSDYQSYAEFSSLIGETLVRPPYGSSGCDYEIIDGDTLLVIRNEFHTNFKIKFLSKSPGESTFTYFDFEKSFANPGCDVGNFDARIPVFDPNGKEGIITYSIVSLASFPLTFSDDSVKVEFHIYDRALNKSNTVQSPPFFFCNASSVDGREVSRICFGQ